MSSSISNNNKTNDQQPYDVQPLLDHAHVQQTVQYDSSNRGNIVDFKPIMDETFSDGHTVRNELADFLSRQVEIFSVTWTEGTRLSTSFAPWRLFFDNPDVKDKLKTYAYIQCDLELQIYVNSTPFYYGKAYFGYRPLPIFGVLPFDSNTEKDCVWVSQMPHVLLNPAENKGGVMTLPFFYHKNWLLTSSAQDFTDMGTIYLESPYVLEHANAVAGADVSIKVLAHAKNVRLSGATASLVLQSQRVPVPHHLPRDNFVSSLHRDLSKRPRVGGSRYVTKLRLGHYDETREVIDSDDDHPYRILTWDPRPDLVFEKQSKRIKRKGGSSQSSMAVKTRSDNIVVADSDALSTLRKVNSGFKDEYGQGVVSTVASGVAKATGLLTEIPVVGPFATATSMVAGATARVANLFGWTNVPNVADVQPFKDTPFHAFASPDISTPVEKLGVDPKNELSVDSRTVGLDGTDEMSIESIATHTSYVGKIDWDEADVSGTVLLSANVSPYLSRESAGVRYHTPLSHLSQAFKYWRGGIVVSFDCYRTKYHSGRLRIRWDPRSDVSTGNFNQVFSQIWDISTSDKCELLIPYNQDLPWKKCLELDSSQAGFGGYVTSGAAIAADVPHSNGRLTVEVLIPLTGPTASAHVPFTFSVTGAPDFRVATPRAMSIEQTVFEPQGRFVPQSAKVDIEPESVTEERDTHVIVNSMAETAEDCTLSAMNLVTMGEEISSIRPLLRRTSRYAQWFSTPAVGSEIRYMDIRLPRFPVSPGYDPNGFHQTSGVGNPRFNFVNHTYYSWFSPCFIGQRGSINYRVNAPNAEAIDTLSVIRSPGNLSIGFFNTSGAYSFAGSQALFASAYVDEGTSGMRGMALINQKTQTGLATQIPMYSQYRMMSTVGTATGKTSDASNEDSFVVHSEMLSTSGFNTVHLYYSVGTDFNLFFYINAPTMFVGTVPGPL